MPKLTVNLPNMPKDADVEIPPYGMFKNGRAYELEELEEDLVYGDPKAKLAVIQSDTEPESPSVKTQDADATDQAAGGEEGDG